LTVDCHRPVSGFHAALRRPDHRGDPGKRGAELNRKLAHGGRPLSTSPPAHSGIPDGEVKQLERGIVVGEAAARFDDFAQRQH
jgi:hypothetical protein